MENNKKDKNKEVKESNEIKQDKTNKPKSKLTFKKVFPKIIITVGILLIIIPLSIKLYYKLRGNNDIDTFIKEKEEINKNDPLEQDELYKAMKQYNENLVKKGQNLRSLEIMEKVDFDLRPYGYSKDVVGMIEIPKLGVRLPLYLGCSIEYMHLGASVISQTSLPIGGEDTNTVLAGHRGEVDKFIDIDKLQVGDEVLITNFWQQLTYKVRGSEIVGEDDSNKIYIQPGKEMLTLLTCHPYQVYKERLLVYCDLVKKE